MGEHKGWRLTEDKRTGRWRGLVLIPGTGGYRSKTFASQAEARKWARDQAAVAVVGGPSALEVTGRALASAMIPTYLAGLEARGRSASHLRNVRRSLEGAMAVAPDLAAAGAGAAIERWLEGMPSSPATRNRVLTEVRALCHWAMRRDLLVKDPTRAIDRASVPEYLRPQFTVEEVRRLLAVRHRYSRHFALMTLAGLRSGEAGGIRWRDVDRAGGILLVRLHGHRVKRNKERIVPLPQSLALQLGPAGAPDDPVAEPMTDTVARRAWVHLLTLAGVEVQDRSPHSCRHTYAGLMTATGVPGLLLSAYLGHSSADTTMVYTKLAARYAQDPEVRGWGRGELFHGGLER